jgi:hypothetical protein
VLFDPLLVFEVEQRVLYLATPAPTTIDQKNRPCQVSRLKPKESSEREAEQLHTLSQPNLFLGSIAIDIKHQASKRE